MEIPRILLNNCIQPQTQDMKVKKNIHILKTIDKSTTLNLLIMIRQKQDSTKTTSTKRKICNVMKTQTYTFVIMRESL